MRRLAAGMIAYALVALGFVISMLNAYLLGRVKSNLSINSGADFLRLHSVQNTALVGILGGASILVIGHILLYKSMTAINSAAQQ